MVFAVDEAKHPWTPVEAEPEDGWPAVADAVPIIVRAWRRQESGVALPHLPTTGGFGVSVKRDWSGFRAHQFAEAWRQLLRDGTTREAVERLHRTGMLVPVKGAAQQT